MDKMKHWIAAMILPLALMAVAGCDDEDGVVAPVDRVPATPQGVYSVTGDHLVRVYWYGIYETDVKEYRVYRSFDDITGYTMIGSVDAVANPDLNLAIYQYADGTVSNGTTYYYAVAAVDYANQESDLSAEDVYDTPRPAGDATVYTNDVSEALSGLNLANGTTVSWTSPTADIFFDRVEDTTLDVYYVYLNAANANTDIQDMGFHYSFNDVGWAPTEGWSDLGYVEAISGHIYVIWTADYHFAKVRVDVRADQGLVNIQWAYQTSLTELGQLELAAPARPEHGDDYPASKGARILK